MSYTARIFFAGGRVFVRGSCRLRNGEEGITNDGDDDDDDDDAASSLGAAIKYVRQTLGIFDPLPLVLSGWSFIQ